MAFGPGALPLIVLKFRADSTERADVREKHLKPHGGSRSTSAMSRRRGMNIDSHPTFSHADTQGMPPGGSCPR